MKNLFLLLLSIVGLSCSNDDETKFASSKTIMFGAIYGECAGDCRTLYLLTEQAIYKDSDTDTEFGNWENTSFENEALPLSKFELAKPLLEIPTGLLDSKNKIGVDLLADFDYFIRIEQNGKSKTWMFDEISDNAPSDFKDYFRNLIQINGQLLE
ncbi:MAG: hypothetical protein WBM98_08370, partial [Maribacter sp.]|uniref:hypothetical protein n=1 Tax=Maribacter sp. TaxID=1897614 RepID=UPI003C7309DC